MTGTDIIARFNLQVDDSSELSSSEELDLVNEVYSDVSNDRPWEWLRATATGTTSTSVSYIALPSDFREVKANKDGISVIFVGTDYQEYKVISFSDRRSYRNQNGFCYIDIPTQRLYFTLQPTTAKAIEYDYIKIPTVLTTSTSPLFREGFHKIIAYGMAARFNPIELSDKSTSYMRENTGRYLEILSDMRIEDANIKLSI